MKVVYIIIILVVILLIFLGSSIYSTTSTIKDTIRSAANEIQSQRGGKRVSKLMTLLYLILAIAAVVFILSKLNK
jgi:uncharacterized membrane protein